MIINKVHANRKLYKQNKTLFALQTHIKLACASNENLDIWKKTTLNYKYDKIIVGDLKRESDTTIQAKTAI